MLRAVKYRIYPNKAQQERYALGIKETYFTMQSKLTELKKEHTFLSECNSQSLQMALRQLVTAYDNFFF